MRILAVSILILLPTFAFADDPKQIRLWEGPAPGAKGEGPKHTPTLYVYPAPKKLSNGCAVVVLPGGGYYVHAIDHEGAQVAKRLNKAGVTAFVLTYRLKPNGYNEHDAFVDGQRAVRLLRSRAKSLGIDPKRIGVLGFSAGGHLASALGVNFDAGKADAEDIIERASSRPDFMVVCYTVPSPQDQRKGRNHGRKKVTKECPPAFLWTTRQDANRPVETAKFYQMLHEAGVDAEMHIYGGWGPHGLGLAPAEPGVGTWSDLLETWLRRKAFLTDKERVSLYGTVMINGKPLHRGWVKLIPENAPGSPVVATYVTHRVNGKFTFSKDNGPVSGPHRVEVYRVAKEFLTVPNMDNVEVFTGIRTEIQARNNSPLLIELKQ